MTEFQSAAVCRTSSFGLLSTFFILHSSFCLLALAASARAGIDEAKLPPPAAVTVEFERDIKPILETTCWRCHGPERPKSHFRLDNRESALKGGDNGVDIIPGKSAQSPLIHYVARLVVDLEMPPPGKGQPLTAQQVGLLRAWIDQGLNWGATNPPAQFAFSAAPTLRWISVTGDKAKFRELEGMHEGIGGGVEQFSLQEQVAPDEKFSAEGRALFQEHDLQLKLALEKTDVGFVHAGFEQWRRYYDDTGGYYRPFSIPSFNLNRDLYLDQGRAWIDFGLTLPNRPQIVLGYEYQYKDGAKSMLTWGPVSGKNIYPSAKDIDEHVHVAKLDFTYDFLGWHLEDNARVEIYKLSTSRDDASSFSLGPGPDTVIQTREGGSHVQGVNTLRMERQLTDWWLVSGGYLYSRFEGDASFNQATLDSAGVPTFGQFWSSDQITLKRESQAFSLASLFLPVDGLSLSLGVQCEWERQEGAGNINLDEGNPYVPDGIIHIPATVESDLDKTQVMETAGLRYTKIPFTVLFAEGRFEQESIGQFEEEDGGPSFIRDTDAFNALRDERVGFNTSPWRWFTFSAHYMNRLSETDYDHYVDTTPGYSAFIRHRKIDTDEAEAKLVLHPVNWLRTTLTYQRVTTDYSTTTDTVPGGIGPEGIPAGKYNAQVFGFGVTVTPIQRLYFSGAFTYSDSKTTTAQNGSQSVLPYQGNIYSVYATANYALNNATRFQCAYSYSRADYGQDYTGENLPLGISYTRHGLMAGVSRQLTPCLTTNLRYGYYHYLEPTSGGFNDYTAHGVFATLMLKWPVVSKPDAKRSYAN
jgi:hypothetical protein